MHRYSSRSAALRFALRPGLLALATALTPVCAWSLDAGALPGGAAQVSGSASIGVSGTKMVIDQHTDKLITDWQSFNIGSSASVRFNQPSTSSAALNRVLGSDASQIFGGLSSNGQVFLVNPQGVYFAPGASVSVGGLVASTLNISNDDFLAGRRVFQGDGGSVVNQGQIQATGGGTIALIGAQVVNDGTIQAPGGSAALAAGGKVTLDFDGDRLISVDVDRDALQAQVVNTGLVAADAGMVVMRASARDALYSTVVNNSGIVRARSIEERNGVVVLDGGGQGVAESSGLIDVSGMRAGESGGKASVLGDKVSVTGRIDADGAKNGGTILVGGGFQGQGPERNASATYVGADARLSADSTDKGNGGTVVVWSDASTRFHGGISARGGANGGNGGFVETSGKDWLEALGSVDASAIDGAAGTWLLDPRNVTISNSATSGGSFNEGDPFVPTANSAVVNAGAITGSLNNGTSVLITTGSTGTQSGDITLASGTVIDKTAGGDASLTLQAAGSINLNGTIQSSSNKLDVVLNSRADDGAIGYVDLSGGTIRSNGGDITIGGGSDPTTGYAIGSTTTSGGKITNGVKFGGTTLSSGAGNITVNGQGGTNAASGVNLANSSTNVLEATSGNITLNGKSATGHGILVQSTNHTFRTTSGNISLYGETGGANGGVRIGSSATTASFETDSGRILLDGTALTDAGTGVWVDSGTLTFTTGSAGGIEVRGHGDGTAVLLKSAGMTAGTGGISIVGDGTTPGASGAGQVSVNAGTALQSDGDVLIKSTSHIAFDAGDPITVQTQGGSIVVNSRSQGGDTGYVDLRDASLLSNGGDIVIGGGLDPTTGYAVGASSGITNGVRFGGTTLSSGAGNITVNGQGGTNAASGVNLANSSTNVLEATSGNITLNGKSATGHGILVQSTNHTFRTTSGNISLYGETGGASGGVRIGSSATTASFETDSGRILLDGTALTDAGTGVWVDDGTLSFTTGSAGGIGMQGHGDGTAVQLGDVGLTAGAGGISIVGQGTTAGASGTGQVSLNAGTSLQSSGNVLIKSTSHIAFDAGDPITVQTQGGSIVVNSRSQGGDTGYVDLRDASLLSNGGDIVIGGGLDPTTGYAVGASSGITNGVRFGGTTLSSGAGNIVVNGQGGSNAASGVSMANGSTNLIESGSGNITVRGSSQGQGEDAGSGIIMQTGSHTIRSGTGNITLVGAAYGSGTALRIGTTGSGAASSITTQGGSITLQGSNTGSGDAVYVGAGDVLVAAKGQGQLTIQGNAVQGNAVTVGPIGSSTTTTLETDGGDIRITGASQSGYGVNVYASASSGDDAGRGRAEIASQGGNITLDGSSVDGIGVRNSPISTGDTRIQAANGNINITGRSQNDLGIEIYPSLNTTTGNNGSAVISVGDSSNIGLFADTMSLAGPRTSISGGGTLTIAPLTPDTRVGFGSGTQGELMLTDFNLGAIQGDWSKIVVGSLDAGWVEIEATLPENIKVVPTVLSRHMVQAPPDPDSPEAQVAANAAVLLAGASTQSDPRQQLAKFESENAALPRETESGVSARQAEADKAGTDEQDEDDSDDDEGEGDSGE